MKRCCYLRKTKTSTFLALLSLTLADLLLLAGAVYIVYALLFGEPAGSWLVAWIFFAIVFVPIIIVLTKYWIAIAVYCLRKYKYTDAGIVCDLPNKLEIWYWEDVTGVYVCCAEASAGMTDYVEMICLARTDIPADFEKKCLGFFLARHFKEYLIIDYSEEVLGELKSYYPGEVIDIRATQRKRFGGFRSTNTNQSDKRK